MCHLQFSVSGSLFDGLQEHMSTLKRAGWGDHDITSPVTGTRSSDRLGGVFLYYRTELGFCITHAVTFACGSRVVDTYVPVEVRMMLATLPHPRA